MTGVDVVSTSEGPWLLGANVAVGGVFETPRAEFAEVSAEVDTVSANGADEDGSRDAMDGDVEPELVNVPVVEDDAATFSLAGLGDGKELDDEPTVVLPAGAEVAVATEEELAAVDEDDKMLSLEVVKLPLAVKAGVEEMDDSVEADAALNVLDGETEEAELAMTPLLSALIMSAACSTQSATSPN